MNKKINDIKALVKKECEKNSLKDFYKYHLLMVEKAARDLLARLPKANKEIVMLGVWLHDLQRVRKLKGDHEQVGADEAVKVLKEFNYAPETITVVKDIILTHSCRESIPSTLEARALATADALSHYLNDFFLWVATTGDRDVDKYKAWAKEKLERNYNNKIFFGFAKKAIQQKHEEKNIYPLA
jgi:HD superfamily phosphodiesterase